MSVHVPAAQSPPSSLSRAKLSPMLAWGWALAAILGAGAVATAAILTHDRLYHSEAGSTGAARQDGAPASAAVDEKAPAHDLTTTVVLPEGKFKQADIRVESVQTVDMPKEVAVTGRIEADPNRRVDVRPRASGVVRTVPVPPGSKLKKGDALVVLDSPDVGSARLKVREKQRELATVRVEAAWKAEIAANVRAMIEQFRKGIEPQPLIKQFAGKSLGASRGTLISAFVELEIASHEQEKQTELNREKIMGEHSLFVAQHKKEGAQSIFEGSLESVGFQVAQDDRVARQMVRNAEEMVVDAAQRLRILGVTEDINDLLAHPERASALPSGSEDLTAYPIVAPFDGTVVSTSTVFSQRVELTDTLFVLADLSKVHAVANIDESRFAILPGLGGGKVRLTAAAYPGRSFESRMLYTGAEVDPNTRTVRLVSETDDPEGLLKLGMPINIVLDTATTEKALTVPIGSVVEVEGKGSSVFVPGERERTFVIRPVKLGREALGRQVVAEGLKPGDHVVVAGAFLIKSELLLQQEKEED
jgi:cobalt-zinc-cadmium efflux system membrane fusion protein